MQRTVFTSGARLIIDQDTRFKSAACCLTFLSGSRDEKPSQAGITHLLEHLLFKRTKSKNTSEIAQICDVLGGEINALTDCDSLSIYGFVPQKKLSLFLRLIFELIFEADFNDNDLELEKEVIRNEMLELEDDPSALVYRVFCENYWRGSSLARTVIGTEESLSKIELQHVKDRLREVLVGNKIIISIVGGVDIDETVTIVSNFLEPLASQALVECEKLVTYGGTSITPSQFGQAYLLLGHPYPEVKNKNFTAADISSVIIGEGASSRLYSRLREQAGIVYDIGSEIEVYPSASVLLISACVEPANLNNALKLIAAEIKELAIQGVSTEEFERAKSQIKSQLLLEEDGVLSRLWRLLESEILYGEYLSYATLVQRVDNVAKSEVDSLLSVIARREAWQLSLLANVEDNFVRKIFDSNF